MTRANRSAWTLRALLVAGALVACEGGTLAPNERSLALVSLWTAPPPIAAGTALPEAPRLRVENSAGRSLVGVPVSFVVVAGGGSVSALTAITDAAGEVTVDWTLGVRTGTQVLRAFVPSVTNGASVTFSVDVFAGPPATMRFLVANATLLEGMSSPTSISFRDSAGLTVAAPGPIAYSSADESVASISASGVVTAGTVGSTLVIATSGTLADSAVVHVWDGPPTIVPASFGGASSFAIAITPGQTLLLALYNADSVLRRNTATGAALASVAMPRGAFDIASRPDGARALTTPPGFGASTLLEIDVAAGTLVRSIATPFRPLRVVYSADGAMAYATTQAGVVMRVNLTTLQITELAVPGGGDINGIALSPDGALLAVTSTWGYVNVISTSSFTLVNALALGGTLQGVAFSVDGASLFVAVEDGPIRRLNAGTMAVEASSSVLGGHFDLEPTPDGKYLVATVSQNSLVRVFSPGTLEFLTSVDIGTQPRRLAADPVTGAVWVSAQGGSVTRIEIF